MKHSSVTRFAWLSIAAAILTIGLKGTAYQLTGSIGLLSDALESFINLVGALMALAMLTIGGRPADEDHFLESLNDPPSWEDVALDRAVAPTPVISPNQRSQSSPSRWM